jgi:hypothetical protein
MSTGKICDVRTHRKPKDNERVADEMIMIVVHKN